MLISNFPGGAKKQLRTEIILWDQDWVVPKGVTSVAVRLFGAGGGGCSGIRSGGGGGSGHMSYNGAIAVVPGSVIPITIGIGGVGGTTPTAGGATSFGVHLSAAGGSPGTAKNGGDGGAGGGSGNGYDYTDGVAGSGSYGGGGGQSKGIATPAACGTYGGKGGAYGVVPTAGTNTIGLGLEFEGTGAAGVTTSSARGGSGGYGGPGGNGFYSSTGVGHGGGGGYGAAGGNGHEGAGGGGGGYGGKGGDAVYHHGGGGGGYGRTGNASTGGAGIAAGGTGAYTSGSGMAVGAGGPGICIIQYYA